MSDIKERLRKIFEAPTSVMGGESFAIDVRDIRDALAEIEWLEAEVETVRAQNFMTRGDLSSVRAERDAARSALTKALKQAQDFRAQVETMRAALRALMNSVGQPESDGADMRVWEMCVEALSTPPAETETDEARDERRARAIDEEAFEDYDKARKEYLSQHNPGTTEELFRHRHHETLRRIRDARNAARAIAESDREARQS